MILHALIIAQLGWATPDTTHCVVLNHGRVAGEMIVVRDGDSTVVRYRYVDRFSLTRVNASYRFSAQGSVLSAHYRELGQNSPVGDVVERFEALGDSVRWTSSRSSGGGAALADPNAFYRPRPAALFGKAVLVRFLLRQPRLTARLWPPGNARLEIVADTTLPTPSGRTRLRLAMVFTEAATPFGIWLDEHDELFRGRSIMVYHCLFAKRCAISGVNDRR